MTENAMLVIDDLYVNFYTPEGVVKAIDGVNLELMRGETLGLVGETGCGKSVTASTIIKLVPIPPGKIERGRIIFDLPAESYSNLESLLRKRKALLASNGGEKDAPEVKEVDHQLDELTKGHDLIKFDKKAMQKINGKRISMIFQEPMTALNPVFTAGDQIAEIILLHERVEVAQAVVDRMLEDKARMKRFKKGKLSPTEKHEWSCSVCGNNVAEKTDFCPNCEAYFRTPRFRHLHGIKNSWYMRNYRKMIAKPGARGTRYMAKVPFLGRFEKPLKRECTERAERMLRLVRIPDPKNVIHSYPHELSGGMQQRVMIAMALACKPQVLIADEPTTALDVTIQAQILKLLKELQEETGTSILLITHNLGVVAETCDRLGVMYAGTIAEIGANRDVFKEPLHPYTQGLLNSIPRMNVEITRLETIEGNVPNLVKPPSGCRFHPRCPFAMEVCRQVKPPMQEIRPKHYAACHLYGEVNLNG
jgi:peptide/nickel transport system ATP-binding protein